jgi:hypothetical protein
MNRLDLNLDYDPEGDQLRRNGAAPIFDKSRPLPEFSNDVGIEKQGRGGINPVQLPARPQGRPVEYSDRSSGIMGRRQVRRQEPRRFIVLGRMGIVIGKSS